MRRAHKRIRAAPETGLLDSGISRNERRANGDDSIYRLVMYIINISEPKIHLYIKYDIIF